MSHVTSYKVISDPIPDAAACDAGWLVLLYEGAMKGPPDYHRCRWYMTDYYRCYVYPCEHHHLQVNSTYLVPGTSTSNLLIVHLE